MLRQTFERDLQSLQDEILVLGSMVEEALMESVNLLKKRDLDGSHRLIEADQRINEKRFAIENDTLTLIATQQPMAGDLRTLAAVLEIATELERIGDYAKGIANINLMIGDEPLVKPLIDIPRMAEKARTAVEPKTLIRLRNPKPYQRVSDWTISAICCVHRPMPICTKESTAEHLSGKV